MEESKREKMLEKVRGLLAKAASTDNEHEKDSFYAAADRLMTEYAIDEFEIRDLAEGQQQVKAITRRWNICPKEQKHLADAMATLASAVVDHCRCKCLFYNLRNPQWGVDVICVGLESDVDWCEMLFTSLQLHLMSNISPRMNPGEDEVDYIIRAKHAGMKWEQIALMLGWIADLKDFTKPIGLRMYGRYKKACEDRGIEQIKAAPVNWQYNFATSYSGQIWTRLYEIKRLNESATVGHELVLVSMKAAVDEAYEDLLGGARLSGYVPPDRKRNPSASLAGRVAADRADLGSKRVGGSGKAIGE